MTYEVGDSSTMATTNPPTIGLTKLLYSVSETAHLLSLSRSTVYAFMKSGELLAVYPTSKARIPAGAIRQFVQNSEDLARAERQSQRLRIR
jgi:excisionase family DNA binding protein